MVTSWVVVRCADIRNTTPYPQELLLRDGNWSLTCGFEVAVGHLTQPASAPGPTTAERVSVEGERLRRALEPEQRPSLPDAAQERRRVVLGHLRQQPAIGDDGAVEVAQEQRARAPVGRVEPERHVGRAAEPRRLLPRQVGVLSREERKRVG